MHKIKIKLVDFLSIKLSLKLSVICFLSLFNTSSLFSQDTIFKKVNRFTSEGGLEIGFGYIGDYFSNLHGGIKKKSSILHNIDFNLSLDLYKSLGWKNAKLHTHFLGNYGNTPNNFVGSIQGISNIAAPNTWKIFEFWIEQNLFEDKLSILFGLYDLNSEFDFRESSSVFINPSHGIGPDFSLTGKNGPSIFPTTSLSLRINYSISDNISLKMVTLDAVPGNLKSSKGTHILLDKKDGFLIATELNVFNGYKIEDGYYKLAIGTWVYSEKFDRFDHTDIKSRNFGIYGFAEKFLLTEENNVGQGLIGFLRVGIAENNVNQICNYYGAGANYIGFIPGRDTEVLGIAVSASSNSNYFLNSLNPNKKNEIIFELTYQINILNYFLFQPDVQYIMNPTFSKNKDALVLGIRLNISL